MFIYTTNIFIDISYKIIAKTIISAMFLKSVYVIKNTVCKQYL